MKSKHARSLREPEIELNNMSELDLSVSAVGAGKADTLNPIARMVPHHITVDDSATKTNNYPRSRKIDPDSDDDESC